MNKLKGMDDLFMSFMETDTCQTEQCKKAEDLSKCMRQKCDKQMKVLAKNLTHHIDDVKRLLEIKLSEPIKNDKKNKDNKNKIEDALRQLASTKIEIEDAQEKKCLSFAALEKKLDAMNKYYKLL